MHFVHYVCACIFVHFEYNICAYRVQQCTFGAHCFCILSITSVHFAHDVSACQISVLCTLNTACLSFLLHNFVHFRIQVINYCSVCVC